jgi:hypothetical protein
MHKDDKSRPDKGMAALVEDGIEMSATDGQDWAAEYLTERGVPYAVIVRVLRKPNQRRALNR